MNTPRPHLTGVRPISEVLEVIGGGKPAHLQKAERPKPFIPSEIIMVELLDTQGNVVTIWGEIQDREGL